MPGPHTGVRDGGINRAPAGSLGRCTPRLDLGSAAFSETLRQHVGKSPPRERRREAREAIEIDLERLCQVISASYGVEPSALKRRGSRHPARTALAYLARRYTATTNAGLVSVLGVSRAESVPNLTRRFVSWLEADLTPLCVTN